MQIADKIESKSEEYKKMRLTKKELQNIKKEYDTPRLTDIKEEITENVFNENIEEPEQTDKTIYMVKEYNGKIGVFKENALIYTMDVHIFTLPEYDKNLLACGIKAEGIDELYRILGEYYK